jgi:hypothetical protein
LRRPLDRRRRELAQDTTFLFARVGEIAGDVITKVTKDTRHVNPNESSRIGRLPAFTEPAAERQVPLQSSDEPARRS